MSKNTMSVEAILELIKLADLYKPIVKSLVESVVSYGSEIRPIVDGVSDYMVERNSKSFKRYVEEFGFSREEAVLLILNQNANLYNAIKNSSSKSIKSNNGEL